MAHTPFHDFMNNYGSTQNQAVTDPWAGILGTLGPGSSLRNALTLRQQLRAAAPGGGRLPLARTRELIPQLSTLPGLAPTDYTTQLGEASQMAKLQLGLALAARGFGSMGAQPRVGEMAISTVGREMLAPLGADAMTVAQQLYDQKLKLKAADKAQKAALSQAALSLAATEQAGELEFFDKALIAELGRAPVKLQKTAIDDLQVDLGDGKFVEVPGFSITNPTDGTTTDYGPTIGGKNLVLDFDPASPGYNARIVDTGDSGSNYEASDSQKVTITQNTLDFMKEKYGLDLPETLLGQQAFIHNYIPKGDAGPEFKPYARFQISGDTFDLREATVEDAEITREDLVNLAVPWSDESSITQGIWSPDEISNYVYGTSRLPSVVSKLRLVPNGLTLDAEKLLLAPSNRFANEEEQYFLRNDGEPITPIEHKALEQQFRSAMQVAIGGPQELSQGERQRRAVDAIRKFMGRTVSHLGLKKPEEISGVRPTDEKETDLRLKNAFEQSKVQGADAFALYANIPVSSYKQEEMDSYQGKIGVAVQAFPEVYSGPMSIDNIDDAQVRVDTEQALTRTTFDAFDSDLDHTTKLMEKVDARINERKSKQSSESSAAIQTYVKENIDLLRAIYDLENVANRANITGIVAGPLSKLAVLVNADDYFAKHPGAWDTFITRINRWSFGHSRAQGKDFGDARISNADADKYEKLVASLTNPGSLNRAIINDLKIQVQRNLGNAMREAGTVAFSPLTLEEAIGAGVDLSRIQPKHNWVSPYFAPQRTRLSRNVTPVFGQEKIDDIQTDALLESIVYEDRIWVPKEEDGKIVGKWGDTDSFNKTWTLRSLMQLKNSDKQIDQDQYKHLVQTIRAFYKGMN